jgi:hypothetical protein
MRLCCPGVTSSCQKGRFRYKQASVSLPSGFKISELLECAPPLPAEVLSEVSKICFDCGQKRQGPNSDSPTGNYCEECFEEEPQASATWAAFLHHHHL